MQVDHLRIILFESTDSESSRVAVGLYSKYAANTKTAAVAHFRLGSMQLYQDLMKGMPKENFTSAAKITNKEKSLKEAIKNVGNETIQGMSINNDTKKDDATDPELHNESYGLYFVSQGMGGEDATSAEVCFHATQSVVPEKLIGNIKQITFCQCWLVTQKWKQLDGYVQKPTAKQLQKMGISTYGLENSSELLNFLYKLQAAGGHPVVAAWDDGLTAAPVEKHPVSIDGTLIDMAAQSQYHGRKFVGHPTGSLVDGEFNSEDKQVYQKVNAELREKHKICFQLTSEGKLIAGSPAMFAQILREKSDLLH